MTETLITRTLTFDRKAGKGDVFPCVATTEAPVLRSYGWEIMEMARMDLSRAPLPVIESHDTSKLNIGLFENVHIDGDKLRGTIRLGKTARAKELAEDIKAGIVRSLSVGYEISDGIESGEIDGIPVYRFASRIFEVSLVAAPADTNAGFYRNLKGKNIMETQDFTTTRDLEESRRISTITALAEKYDLEQLGMRSIAAGTSVKDFNAEALKAIDERNAASRTRSQDGFAGARFAGMPADTSQFGRSLEKYSIVRVLRGLSDHRALSECGLEMEISQDLCRTLGKRTSGIVMPYEMLMQRAVTAAGSGGNLIATDHQAGSFVDVLRNASLVMQLGPTVLRGLVGDVAIPRKTGGASAYWFGADGSDSITESDLTLDQLSLSPKTVGGAVTFSHRMLVQSSPGIEQLVRRDLADLIATEIDLKALQGSGASNQPLGVLNASGIGAIDFAADDPTYAEVVQMETALAEANADRGDTLAWLMTPAMAEALRTTPKQSSGVEGNFIWGDGRICGIPAYRTANMPSGTMLLGNWQHLLLAFWGGIEISADAGGTNFLKGSISVRVLADVDVNVRHPGAFCSGVNLP